MQSGCGVVSGDGTMRAWTLILGMVAASLLAASDRPPKGDKNSPPAGAGEAVKLRVKREVGKFLIYEGKLHREQKGTNSFIEDSDFYLNVLTTDRRDGLDMVSTMRSYTDRKRKEFLESGKTRTLDALPLNTDQLSLGPNFEQVGVLHCYAHSPQNAIAYRTDQVLSLRDGSQLRGRTIAESDDKIIFLTETEKFDVARSNIASVSTIEVPHICLGETPHYLFPIFSARAVALGDSWTFRVPVIIPVEQPGQQVLPSQFSAKMTGKLRDLRGGVATVDYEVSGEFDTEKEEFHDRFPLSFHQNNHLIHSLQGSGTVTLDVEKGWILSKEETFTFTLYGVSIIPGKTGEDAKREENKVTIVSQYSSRLVKPGERLKTGALVPDYETGAADVNPVDGVEPPKENKKDKKKK
jgi:hypothetical protein